MYLQLFLTSIPVSNKQLEKGYFQGDSEMVDKFLVSLMLQAKGRVSVICQVTSEAGFDARAGYTYAT